MVEKAAPGRTQPPCGVASSGVVAPLDGVIRALWRELELAYDGLGSACHAMGLLCPAPRRLRVVNGWLPYIYYSVKFLYIYIKLETVPARKLPRVPSLTA